MASVKFDKDSKEFQFFGVFWKFVQQYYIPENTEEYWNGLYESARKIEERFPGDFYTSMLLAFIDHAEKGAKA